jgi:hypothetical protein
MTASSEELFKRTKNNKTWIGEKMKQLESRGKELDTPLKDAVTIEIQQAYIEECRAAMKLAPYDMDIKLVLDRQGYCVNMFKVLQNFTKGPADLLEEALYSGDWAQLGFNLPSFKIGDPECKNKDSLREAVLLGYDRKILEYQAVLQKTSNPRIHANCVEKQAQIASVKDQAAHKMMQIQQETAAEMEPGIPKARAAAEIIFANRGKKIVVFTRFGTSQMEAVLRSLGVAIKSVTADAMVFRALDDLRKGVDGSVLLLDPDCYGRGLNMEFADILILCQLPTDEVLTQWIGRVQRHGRTCKLQIYVLLCEHEASERRLLLEGRRKDAAKRARLNEAGTSTKFREGGDDMEEDDDDDDDAPAAGANVASTSSGSSDSSGKKRLR